MRNGHFDKHAKFAFLVACTTLLASGVLFQTAVKALNLYLKKERVDLRAPLSLISTNLGNWKAVGADRTLESAMIEELGTDKYLDRVYVSEVGGRQEVMQVHLAYYTGMIDTVPHVPDRCMVAAGFNAKTLPANIPLPIDREAWMPDPEQMVNLASDEPYSVVRYRDATGRTISVRMPVGDLKLRTVRFEREDNPDLRIFGGYFFIANGRATPSPEGVKMLSFDPTEKYAYYCKVQLVYSSRSATEESFLELSSDILKDLLPEVMRCLPDWAEVERRDKLTQPESAM